MKLLALLFALTLGLMAKPQTIVFAAGCFWGVEKHFENLPGVIDAQSGYAGGNYPDPTYHKVLSYRYDTPQGVVNYAESVKVTYDDARISTEDLIKSFWELHDPTQKDRQGNDRGNNYRSAIFYTTPEQKAIALRTKAEYQKLLSKAGYGRIVTEIRPLKTFYPAEAFHQDYLKKNPNGYCPNHATGVKFPQKTKTMPQNTQALTPLGGKEILVIDAENCPYCEEKEGRFKLPRDDPHALRPRRPYQRFQTQNPRHRHPHDLLRGRWQRGGGPYRLPGPQRVLQSPGSLQTGNEQRSLRHRLQPRYRTAILQKIRHLQKRR